MSWILTIVAVVSGALTVKAALDMLRRRRRAAAVRLPEDAVILREAKEVPVRLWVDRSIAGGPSADGINRGAGHMVLTEHSFVLATWQGRVLEVAVDHPGEARCVGPRQLVIEGLHPTGRARVRAEIIVDDAADWAAAIAG